jgi:hypothetical protein
MRGQLAWNNASTRRIVLGPVAPLVLLAALAALVWLSPAEATLGETVKLVYLHGALQRVSIVAFVVAGALGLLQLLLPRRELGVWIQAAIEAALACWLAQVLVSLPAQWLAWGGITLSEPRVASALWIAAGTLMLYSLARWLDARMWLAAAAIVNAVIVLAVLRGAVNILHPLNPIFGSDSLEIKLFYGAITLVTAGLTFLLAVDRANALERSSM